MPHYEPLLLDDLDDLDGADLSFDLAMTPSSSPSRVLRAGATPASRYGGKDSTEAMLVNPPDAFLVTSIDDDQTNEGALVLDHDDIADTTQRPEA
jgi:hypothetical protein